ncbi:serine/threonine-protein kinase A-Raf isoform X3 [Octopus sinensis]|uniref:non-specific serine/threonine protein kinase n=1 Tax=Octopus sinensis TaxID=2607531 RepID=A0A7E6EUV6_9MOLL|nr:serine/threonine-protein kinase A-Raf isoform X3 [Octopus sinensis]
MTTTDNQLKNIRNVIRLTKEKLEDMNKEFGKHQHPHPLYIQEYEQLTNKIHDFQLKEQQLLDKVIIPSSETEDEDDDEEEEEKLPSPTNSSTSSPKLPLKSPVRSTIKVLLPNAQFTRVHVKPGVTLKGSLAKAMKLRDFEPDRCLVFIQKPWPRKFIPWDVDLSMLAAEELSVEFISQHLPTDKPLCHNYVRKTFFTIAFCDLCRKLLFHGCYRCATCGLRVHQRCIHRAYSYCDGGDDYHSHYGSPNRISEPMYNQPFPDVSHTLPTYVSSPFNQFQTLPNQRNTRKRPPPICQRERSTSAPNVCCNLVNSSFLTSEQESGRKNMDYPGDHSNVAAPGTNHSNRSNMSHRQALQYKDKRHASDSITAICKISPFFSSFMSRGHNTNCLAPPNSGSSHSQGNSPTKIHSARGSPTNQSEQMRPRAKSVESELGQHVRLRRDSNEEWELPDKEIILIRRIGSGSFGTVFCGHWHGPVAVKKLNVVHPTPAQLEAFKNEVAVLKKTRHLNILLFMGYTIEPQLQIVTQWCEGSSLYKRLHVEETKYDMSQLVEIGRQTSQGMDYLHAKFIIHRDLKSNNIFLTEDFTVKIGDFGLATVKARWSGSHQFQQPTGSILWMAPEVIRMKDDNPYTFQSDVYAYGIVCFELMTSSLPYSHINNKDQILFMVGKGHIRPDPSKSRSDTPKAFKRLMMECCKYDRNERPLFPQILSSIESLKRSLQRLQKSHSEPTLRPQSSDDLDLFNVFSSPKTPVNCQYAQFTFYDLDT